MWKAYLQVIKEKIPHAINILDRFHVMQKFSKALDQIRVQEVKRLKAEGKEPVLKHSRWCFLKRRFNLTRSQRGKLKEFVEMNLNIVKAYLLKEQFHKFWEYKSPTWAGKFLTNGHLVDCYLSLGTVLTIPFRGIPSVKLLRRLLKPRVSTDPFVYTRFATAMQAI